MLGLIFLFLCGWLIYAGLCRLVFGKPDKPESMPVCVGWCLVSRISPSTTLFMKLILI